MKIREAILSVKSYQGAEGIYGFDQNGDGLHGYNVVKNDNGKKLAKNESGRRDSNPRFAKRLPQISTIVLRCCK